MFAKDQTTKEELNTRRNTHV